MVPPDALPMEKVDIYKPSVTSQSTMLEELAGSYFTSATQTASCEKGEGKRRSSARYPSVVR